jgi:hypothetical protein
MAQLVIQDEKHLVNGSEVLPGMAIRRYDLVAGEWYVGRVGIVSSYRFEQQQRVSSLHLVVEGFVPSPLVAGDEIEFL